MSHLKSFESTSKLQDSIPNVSVIYVNDGSYFPWYKVWACGWLIATPDGTLWIEGGGIVHSVHHEKNSYQSKIAGQLGVTTLFDSIILPISSYHIFIVCDGLAALNILYKSLELIKCRGKYVDLIPITT